MDALPILAEVSVALAGFASLVVILKRRPSGRWRKVDVDRYLGMVVNAAIALFFALFPLVVASFDVTESTLWGVGSALLGLATFLQTAGAVRAEWGRSHPLRLASIWIPGSGTVLLQVFNVFGVVWDRAPGPYLAGVGWHVFQALVLFVGLVAIPPSDVESS